jgi:hypothetical protein
MRRNSYRKIFITLLAITLLYASCKKGDTGPAGAAGAAGTPGATGATGPEGPKGDTGTANVIYSQWLDVAFTPIEDTSGVDTLGYEADIPAAKLDSAILANGEIKVYVNLGTSDDPAVVPLPYLDIYTININPIFFIQDIYLYEVPFGNFIKDPSTYTDPVTGKHQQYRYILVPGSVNGRVLKPNWKDYNAVKAFYGLKD